MHTFRRTRYGLAVTAAVLAALGLTTGMSPYKFVDVVVGGRTKAGGTYASETVGAYLRRSGLRVANYDLVEPARTAQLHSGMKIVVIMAKRVTVRNGGAAPVFVHTLTRTVGQLLRTMRIRLGRRDSVNVPLSARIRNGMRVAVTRRRLIEAESMVALPYSVERQADSRYSAGTDVVAQAGRSGTERVIVRRDYVNGKLVRTVRRTVVLQQPVDEIIDVGTASSTPVVASRSDASLVSSGSISVVATAYANPGGYTATGAPAGYGDVAVDPSVIPLGTKLYIPGYGYGVADDTGGAIQGYRIDLCFNSVSQAWNYGRHVVRIYILGRG